MKRHSKAGIAALVMSTAILAPKMVCYITKAIEERKDYEISRNDYGIPVTDRPRR